MKKNYSMKANKTNSYYAMMERRDNVKKRAIARRQARKQKQWR